MAHIGLETAKDFFFQIHLSCLLMTGTIMCGHLSSFPCTQHARKFVLHHHVTALPHVSKVIIHKTFHGLPTRPMWCAKLDLQLLQGVRSMTFNLCDQTVSSLQPRKTKTGLQETTGQAGALTSDLELMTSSLASTKIRITMAATKHAQTRAM